MTIKVLVVDSGSSAASLARDTLTPLGCQIITASSTALGVFLARKNRPCLIINGLNPAEELDLPQEISLDPDLAPIPVVVLVAPGASHQHTRSTAPSAGKVLEQPLSPERFFDEIRPYLIDRGDREETPTDQSTQ